MDCTHRKSPIGQNKAGIRPVDRKEKLRVLHNKNGFIIGISVGSARDHDIQLCHETLQSIHCTSYSRDTKKYISMQHKIRNICKLPSSPITIFPKIAFNQRNNKKKKQSQPDVCRRCIEPVHSWLYQFRASL